jgi:hypothetical protein
VRAIFLATSLFSAPAELSSSDSTLLDGMVCITLHEDGLALSSKSLDTVYALHKLCKYSVSCRVLEDTDVAYDTIRGVVEGTAAAMANIAINVLRTAH